MELEGLVARPGELAALDGTEQAGTSSASPHATPAASKVYSIWAGRLKLAGPGSTV